MIHVTTVGCDQGACDLVTIEHITFLPMLYLSWKFAEYIHNTSHEIHVYMCI